jgi:catechol-2,3-dioxygenase
MALQELHRGRLIDHIQLVVKDLAASRSFYEAVFKVLDIPIGGTAKIFSGRTNFSSPPPTARPRKAD